MKNFDLKENSYGHKKRLNFIIKQVRDSLNYNGKSKDTITILDVGCGSGLLITSPLAKLGYNILGIDIDEDSIKFAKENNIYDNASFLHSNLSDIKDQYDIIIASEILEHLSNPDSFLKELTNKMTSNSILILTTPNGYGWFEMEKWILNLFMKISFLKKILGKLKKEKLEITKNKNDKHLQKFTLSKLHKLFYMNNLSVKKWENGPVFGGPITERTFALIPGFKQFSNWLGDILPAMFSLVWYMTIKKENMNNDENLKNNIKNFWNKKPCGTFGNIPLETDREYFDKIKNRRYTLEPFIPKITQFESWNNKKVLEIGCGIGMDGIEFAKHGAEYTGIDLSDKSIRLCKKHFDIYGQRGDIINTDAETLPFKDNTFDLVYSWGVLHHIPNMQKSIDEIYRVLKPNGKIIIMIYNKYSLVGLQLYLFYGLAKMRLFSNLNKLYYTHHESEGTKAFTNHETMAMFKSFHNTTLKNIVTPYDLRISRNKFLPKFFSFLVPPYLGFFKVIIGYKQQ